ncbi:amine oxidase, flavin-containing superfamily [Phaeosphaeria sp. MPI-PUGE-AT-0046c]|nr:amine oxidase, flavin-containing superfamily [Phaeosphaeria sp. MPI-PUGE-AT-0046c]
MRDTRQLKICNISDINLCCVVSTMQFQVRSALLLSAFFSSSSFVSAGPPGNFDLSSFKQGDIIYKDVAIVGGGSAGTYSAISLKDKGHSVIVIEKKNRIGGNTETYIDPATKIPVDVGVQMFHNISVVTDYFKRFNIPLIVYGSDATNATAQFMKQQYDFRTGKAVNISFPSATDVGAAFGNMAKFLAQYPKLDDGMYLPDPVPADFLLPLGEFVKKYECEAILNTMFELDPALGDFTTVPAIERIRVFGLSLVQAVSTGVLTTARHNNSELYTKAQNELLSATSLLLSSEVVASSRGDHNVKLMVKTPTGNKLIIAKKILITIPPKVDIMAPFDLSRQETSVFSKMIDVGYYTSVMKNTGIPDNVSVFNYAEDTPYNFPVLPQGYNVQMTPVPGLHQAVYGTPRSAATYPMSDDAVKADIVKGIKRLQKANPDKFKQTEPEFLFFSAHTPFYLQAKPEDIAAGHYAKMYALQGLRNTYWTGASWRAQDSSDIWRFSENEVLPKLIAGL